MFNFCSILALVQPMNVSTNVFVIIKCYNYSWLQKLFSSSNSKMSLVYIANYKKWSFNELKFVLNLVESLVYSFLN